MARARNIKPGFFRNELLAELTPMARLLFAGLWTVADRAGRLEDRPKRIKADVLPYDDCDVDALLGELERVGFVRRYAVGSGQYIEVATFTRHQNPHRSEAASTIPAPEGNACGSVAAPDGPGEGTVPAPEVAGSGPADSLIPETGSRNPESAAGAAPHPDEDGGRQRRARRLPEKFAVSAEMRAWATATTGLSDGEIDAETAKFRDHYLGAGASKADWVATWRNWLRKAVEYRASKRGNAGAAERPWLATPDRSEPFDFFGPKRTRA